MIRWDIVRSLSQLYEEDLACLRPILSHDMNEVSYRFTDRRIQGPVWVTRIVNGCNLSFPMVHRYLDHFIENGLLIGVDVVKDKETKKPGVEEAQKVTAKAFQRGLYLVNMGAFGTRALRVAPPLIINREQADASLEILESAISDVEKEL